MFNLFYFFYNIVLCRQAFPTLTIEDITLAYDIKRLSALNVERDCAEQARLYCENYAKKREPLQMYPYPCGQVIGCCCKNVCNSFKKLL